MPRVELKKSKVQGVKDSKFGVGETRFEVTCLLCGQRELAHVHLVLVDDVDDVTAALELCLHARHQGDVAFRVAVHLLETLGAHALRERFCDGLMHERLQQTQQGIDGGGGVPALLEVEVALEDLGYDTDEVLGLEGEHAEVWVCALLGPLACPRRQ